MTVKGFLQWVAAASLKMGQEVTQSEPRAKLPYGTTGRIFWQKGTRVGIVTPDGRRVFTQAKNLW